MKITKGYLQQVIKEELEKTLNEVNMFTALKQASAEPKKEAVSCPLCNNNDVISYMLTDHLCPVKDFYQHGQNRTIQVTAQEAKAILHFGAQLVAAMKIRVPKSTLILNAFIVLKSIKQGKYTDQEWEIALQEHEKEMERTAPERYAAQQASDDAMRDYYYGR